MDNQESNTEDKISIIGMGCRFPGARNIEEYRAMLLSGKSAFCSLTEQEMTANGVPEDIICNKNYVRSGAPLKEILYYDTNLSGLTKEQAGKIDPQFYHLWECTWEALESANCGFNQSDSRIGVFAGADTSWYASHQMNASLLWDPMAGWDEFLHNDSHFLSTWLSYKFGFIGPSINVQTACSSSLVAVHLACNSLIAGDCDIAIAGGVSIRGPQKTGYLYRSGGIVSPSGICRPFDANSDGTVLSSGAGVVILSRLDDAERKNWPVLGNIIGSAVNNDGNQKVAFTAPNGKAQEELVKEALLISEIDSDTIGYIETHGTGTELGDAVELQSLDAVFKGNEQAKVYIGSSKANIGHLESAAGIAGLIKTVLSVHNDEIYPLSGFTSPNPQLALESTPFIIPRVVEQYDAGLPFRRAGISSFGIGGTNAHIIIENAESQIDLKKNKNTAFWPVYGISGMSRTAGKNLETCLFDHLKSNPKSMPVSGATLLKNRKPLTFRKAIPSPYGSGSQSWISEIKNAEFVQISKSPLDLTLSFDNLPNSNSYYLNNLIKINAKLSNIISTYNAAAIKGGIELKNDSLIASAVIAFSLTEWFILLGLPVKSINGFLSHHLTSAMHSDKSLNETFRKILSGGTDNTLFEYPLIRDKEAIISIHSVNDFENTAAFPELELPLNDPAMMGYQFARLFSYLWIQGYNINWNHYFPEFHPVSLPTYPFQRKEIARSTLNRHVLPVGLKKYPEKKDTNIKGFLKNLWEEILGHTPDECNDFFAMNGDSLAAMQFATAINNELPVSILMEEIFENPIFEDILATLEKKSKNIAHVVHPLSYNQEALYTLCELSPESPVYNVYATYELKGAIDVDALYQSFDFALKEQDVFKTGIIWDGYNFKQQVHGNCDSFLWEYLENISHQTETKKKIEQHIRKIFDLTKPPLFSVLLIKITPDTFYLSAVSHHIVSDEWSAQIIMRDVLLAYEGLLKNSTVDVRRVEKKYVEYVVQEQARLEAGPGKTALQYWITYLKGLKSVENKMPSRGSIDENYSGDALAFNIGDAIYTKVKTLAKKLRTTPFVVLLTSFNILISRQTGQTDLCIGVNLANRNETDVDNLAGYFTNTLPLRIKIKPSDTFSDVAKKCHQAILNVQKNQLPLSAISQNINDSDRGLGRSFFDTIFVLQNVPRHHSQPNEISLRKLHFHNGTSKFNLEFSLEPNMEGHLDGMVEFKTKAFDKQVVTGLIDRYIRLLQFGIKSPETPVFKLDTLSDSEKNTLLYEFNAQASSQYQTQPDFWHCFKQSAVKYPEGTAIITSDNIKVSYSHLMKNAQVLASQILNKGLSDEENTVGIFCDRSEKTAIALLAVQASDKSFVLLDPNLPDRRIKDIIHDSGITILITHTGRVSQLENIGISCSPELCLINLEDLSPIDTVDHQIKKPSNLAYIMYTSGSTGKPKGALVTRSGMMNHLHEKVRTVELEPGIRMAQTASLSFDISIWQFLAPLMCGATLVMFSDEQIFDIDLYLKRIEEQACNVVELVPSYLETILPSLEENPADFSKLNYLMSTGEALPALLCNRWLALFPEIPIINAYGPTECADDVLQHVIDKTQPEHVVIPAGIPLANLQIYILDPNMQSVPIEVIGEIYVGGIGVGLGYLKDPEKTESAFLPNSFSDDPKSKLYRTGDLGAWKNDGTVVYLGRKDTQIKIHGARVELSEIDAILNQCPMIKQAVAVYQDSRKIITVFCIPENKRFDLDGIQAYSNLNLPSFMRPSVFKTITHIPRNSSGKVDRKILLETIHDIESSSKPQQDELTRQELALKEIWETILGIPGISKASNFFDMGGNSLSAIRLVALARKQSMALSPRDVFRYPVLCDMANLCEENPTSKLQELSYQTKLLIGEKQFLECAVNNIWAMDSAFVLELSPHIETEVIKDAVTNIWGLHPGLRSKFYKDNNGQWFKGYHSASTVPFSTIHLNDSLSQKQVRTIVSGYREMTFSEDSPLFNVILVEYRQQNILLVKGHYLVCDLVSWQTILDEFNILLKNKGHKKQDTDISTSVDFVTTAETESRTRFSYPLKLVENHFSDGLSDKDIEALMVGTLQSVLSDILQPQEYQIIIGQNGRDTKDIEIGRYSYMVVLPELKETKGLQFNVQHIKDMIVDAKPFEPLSKKQPYSINLDYLGDLSVNQRSGVLKLDRGNLSPHPGQLFPMELIAWIEKETLVIETAVNKSRFPIDMRSFQDKIAKKLNEYLGQSLVKVN